MPTEAHRENCICAALGNKAPCSWCENGADGCIVCQGEGEYPHPATGAREGGMVSCDDCGGTGIDAIYHEPECMCTACVDPDFAEVEPERKPIWPDKIGECYLEMMRKKGDDSFFRKQLFQDWLPGPRPILVVGTGPQADSVKHAKPGRKVRWVTEPRDVIGMDNFDFVVYAPARMTATETRQMLHVVETIRSRRGVREISIEEAEGRPQRRPGTEYVGEAGRDARLAELPDGSLVVASKDHPPKVIGMDFGRETIDGIPRKDYVEKHGVAGASRQQELAARREPGLRECEGRQIEAAIRKRYAPKTTVPRIERGRRADATVAATVHENPHNLGTETGNDEPHRMGFKQPVEG